MDPTLDVLEEIGRLVPEYSYASSSRVIITDKEVRAVLIREIKKVKEYMFHVVQITYQLHKDRMTEVAQKVWDDTDILLDRAENSRTGHLQRRPRGYCEECKERVEHNLAELIMTDRRLLKTTIDMRRSTYYMYKLLMGDANERRFIKNLDGIKRYKEDISGLIDKREKLIVGV